MALVRLMLFLILRLFIILMILHVFVLHMRLELLMILMLLVGFARLHDTRYHSGRLRENARGQSLLSASPLVLPPSVSPIIGRSLEKGGSALHALLSRDYVSLPAAGGEACAQKAMLPSRASSPREAMATLSQLTPPRSSGVPDPLSFA